MTIQQGWEVWSTLDGPEAVSLAEAGVAMLIGYRKSYLINGFMIEVRKKEYV